MKANWAHLRNISTIITAGALAVQFQVGFPHRQAAVLDSLRPRAHAGLVCLRVCGPRCRPRAQDAGVSDFRKHTAWEGQAGRPHRFSLGWESKSRVNGADPAAGSASPLPIFNSPNLNPDLPGPFVTWAQGRQVHSGLRGDDRALETLWEADASLGQTDRVTKALVLQGGDPQTPGHQA